MIPLLRPSMTDRELAAVQEVLASGWLGNGPICERFERKLAERYGYRHCITTNSATAALHLACKVAGVGPGDEVIVPALTFISTALAVSYCGAKPVFADVRADTLCIDANSVCDCWNDKAKMFIPVDYAGYPAASKGNTFEKLIIQDAAHSCGGIGYGDLVCLSSHPVKPLATGDGGAILTNVDDWAERLRALRWCGINASTWERTKKRYGWDYDIQEIGYKYHWNDIQAAIGLVQLDRLDEMQSRRREIATRYDEQFTAFARNQGCIPYQLPINHPKHTWHLYALRVDATKRDALIDHLLSKGISAGCHYKPLTYYPMYLDQPTPPVTEREWRRLVSLPIYADMTDIEQEQVIEAVKEFFV